MSVLVEIGAPGRDARLRSGWMTFKSQFTCSFDIDSPRTRMHLRKVIK